jgi:DHA2 family multidrug resistance protein
MSAAVFTREPPLEGGMRWLAAAILASANFIAILDMTVANVAVPSIAGSLGITPSEGTWIITSYSVAEAICVPLTGWLAGRIGAVRLIATAMALFGAFSAICGFSSSLTMVVAGRVLQGLAGGLLMPLSQTLLLRIFKRDNAMGAMALWSMTTLVAPVIGPIVGGWLCDNYGWPLIFFINLPIAFICAPVLWRMLRRYEEQASRAPMDVVGLVLLVMFVGALQIMLDIGKDHDWFASPLVWTLAITAVLGFASFLIWELTEEHPIVDLRVFRHRGFVAGVVTLSLGFGAMFATNVVTPLWLQSYMGYTSSWAGKTMAWSGVFAVMAAPFAGRFARKGDPRKLVFVGLLWIAAVTWLRATGTTSITYWQIAVPLMFVGMAMPFFFVPLTSLSLGSVTEKETASAAGLQNFLRTLSGAVATSITATSWDDKAARMHAELANVVDPTATLQTLNGAGLSPDGALTTFNTMVQSQSVMLATNQILSVVAIAFALAAMLVWLAPKPGRAIDITQAAH